MYKIMLLINIYMLYIDFSVSVSMTDVLDFPRCYTVGWIVARLQIDSDENMLS